MEHLLAKEGVAGSIPVSRLNKKGYPIGYPFLFTRLTHTANSGEMRSIFSAVTCLQVTGSTPRPRKSNSGLEGSMSPSASYNVFCESPQHKSQILRFSLPYTKETFSNSCFLVSIEYFLFPRTTFHCKRETRRLLFLYRPPKLFKSAENLRKRESGQTFFLHRPPDRRKRESSHKLFLHRPPTIYKVDSV